MGERQSPGGSGSGVATSDASTGSPAHQSSALPSATDSAPVDQPGLEPNGTRLSSSWPANAASKNSGEGVDLVAVQPADVVVPQAVPVTALVSTVLSADSGVNSPDPVPPAPIDSSLRWALAGWGTRPRPAGQPASGATATTSNALVSAIDPTAPQLVYMGGVLGIKPNYASIVPLSPEQKCSTGCLQIKYDNITVSSGTKALTTWIGANGVGSDTIWTFSESTDSAIEYLSTHTNDMSDHWYLLGSPSTPGNFNTSTSWRQLPAGDYRNVTFVVRQYDSVADYPAGSANQARSNASLSVHRSGYDNLDLTRPSTTWVDPRTGVTVLYFTTYPLPIINTWFRSQQWILSQDKALRPGIESQYWNRPIALPNPW
ncbi:hypothetical protein [Mycolicibacterium psychrotolerans]|uniref:hypothetical protein n=1 Tax=Mycolicibacterium psychrotolerans TaxID=216929 RepID=UPI0013D12C10|nr:hypothetical protein [Mycolicibacterium psychrotolerans]